MRVVVEVIKLFQGESVMFLYPVSIHYGTPGLLSDYYQLRFLSLFFLIFHIPSLEQQRKAHFRHDGKKSLLI